MTDVTQSSEVTVDTTDEAPTIPESQDTSYGLNLYSGFRSAKQAQAFRNFLGDHTTEQQIHARFPYIEVTDGPGVLTALVAEAVESREAAMRGKAPTENQMGKLKNLIEFCRTYRQMDLTVMADSAQRVLMDLAADREVFSRTISTLESRLSVLGVEVPQSKTDEAKPGPVEGQPTLEGSTVTGAVASEPF